MRGHLAADGQLGAGVSVWNVGFGGECASVRGCWGNTTSGAGRIEGLVYAMAWDAVIIMEGFNDLNQGQQTLGSAVNALRFMGQTAKASGATVVMGILEPTMNSLAGAIASMANQEGFARHSFRDVEIGNDDVHPTQAGYDQMAADMYAKLEALFPQ
jgi:lysophospholipase L1-like esterase